MMLLVSQRKEDVTTASICILVTDVLCTVARNAPSESFYKERGEKTSLLHTPRSIKERLQKGNFELI